jgi:hypothetical protein
MDSGDKLAEGKQDRLGALIVVLILARLRPDRWKQAADHFPDPACNLPISISSPLRNPTARPVRGGPSGGSYRRRRLRSTAHRSFSCRSITARNRRVLVKELSPPISSTTN